MPKKNKKIQFTCTAFRDGFQSAYGSRVLSKDYLPIVKMAKEAGIRRFESGGGASFQSAFFYCNENAFDVMDAFRAAVGPDVHLQTLARGVNVVGLDSQSSDIIKLHAQLFKKHGVTMIRNFDALNDPDNLAYSGQCIVDAGLEHQICVAMMSLPPGCVGAHTPAFYEETVKKILKAKIPFHSICFKDASGTSVPSVVYETIRKVRDLVGNDVPLEFHSHETAGVGTACYLAAVEAGADIVDLSLAPVSGGTCQPDVATFWHALRGMPYELDADVDALMQVEEAFKEAMKEYFLPPEALHVEPRIPWSPMPGGALTANTQMLRDNGIMDKYTEIIEPRLMNDENPKKGIKPATALLKANNLPVTDENIFIAATCGEKGITFLKGEAKVAVRYKEKETCRPASDGDYKITLNGETFVVAVKDNQATVNGETYAFTLGDQTPAPAAPVQPGSGRDILAPMMGTVTQVKVSVGDKVMKGQTLFLLEVMKMENEIKAPKDGVITSVDVTKGTQVQSGQLLAKVG